MRCATEHLVPGDAVLHRPHAAGVGGDVPTEARAVLAREHGVHEPVRRGHLVELLEGHPRLHDGDVVLGIYKIIRKHAGDLDTSNAHRRRVSPHLFRHTAAVHLLESGVEVNVIRSWLGHVSLDTTNRYAELTLRAKEAAVRACEPSSGISEGARRCAVWKGDQELLAWLNSL